MTLKVKTKPGFCCPDLVRILIVLLLRRGLRAPVVLGPLWLLHAHGLLRRIVLVTFCPILLAKLWQIGVDV